LKRAKAAFGSNLGTLFLGHGLEPPFPANLTAFAAYGAHVFRDGGGRGAPGHFGRLRFRLWYLAGGNGDSPRGELFGSRGRLPLPDGHSYFPVKT